jgi:hypothetical protein
MPRLLKLLFSACLLSCINFGVSAGENLNSAWLNLIKADFPTSCAVSLIKVGVVVSGNNGLRTEQWFVQSCRGLVEYRVAYYPPAAFPGRPSPYEVQVVLSGSTRPNKSFKPNPLRGSA